MVDGENMNIPDSQTSEVVLHDVTIGGAVESDAVLGRRHVHGWGDVVSKATVLIEVDDQQAIKSD